MYYPLRKATPHIAEDTAKERIFLRISTIDTPDFIDNIEFLAQEYALITANSLLIAPKVRFMFFP